MCNSGDSYRRKERGDIVNMTLQELLKDYIPSSENNPGWPDKLWLKFLGHSQLSSKFRKDISNNPDTQFFHALFSAYKLNYSANDAIEILTKLGISNTDELIVWLSQLGTAFKNINMTALFNILTDKVTLDIHLENISQTELNVILKKQFPSLTDFGFTDSIYQLTDLAGLEELISYDPAPQYKWIAESEDCEDHARILRGWLSRMNLGNIAIAYCEVNVFGGDELKYAHAINLAVIKENGEYQFKFIEPQNNTISDLDFNPPGLTVNRYEVRKLMF